MTDNAPVYSVDTSALLDGLRRHYPESIFVSLWDNVDDLVSAGRLLASEEVLEELKVRDDDALAWLQAREDAMIVPTDRAVAAEVTNVLRAHPNLVKGMRGRNRADPFVIAVARLRSAVVVTGEANDGTSARPKIPFVCGELGIRCIRLLELIQEEGWRY